MNARTANAIAATRQSKAMASTVRTGMNTSCPAELLAPKIPLTSPRLRTNQRGDGWAEDARDQPRADACEQAERQRELPDLGDDDTSSATGSDTRLSDDDALDPSRPINEPDSGPASPYSTRPAAAANDTEAVDQPGSSVIDRRNARALPDAGRHEDHGRRDRDDDPPVEERTHRRT